MPTNAWDAEKQTGELVVGPLGKFKATQAMYMIPSAFVTSPSPDFKHRPVGKRRKQKFPNHSLDQHLETTFLRLTQVQVNVFSGQRRKNQEYPGATRKL